MDQDILDKLASGEYSISPRSGRLRKRVRIKKKKGFFFKSKLEALGRKALWIVLIVGFLVSLILVLPELRIESTNKKGNIEKTKRATRPN